MGGLVSSWKVSAVVASSLGVGLIFDPCIDELKGQLPSTKAAAVSVSSKLSDKNEARNKAKRECKDLLRKIRTKREMSENCIIAERTKTFLATMTFCEPFEV